MGPAPAPSPPGASDSRAPATALEPSRTLGPPWPLRRVRLPFSCARPRTQPLPRLALASPARPTSVLLLPPSNSADPSARIGLSGASDSRAPAPVLELNRSLGPPWPLRRARLPSSCAHPHTQPLSLPALASPPRPTPELQRPSSYPTALSARLGLVGATDSRAPAPVLELNRSPRLRTARL